MRVVFIVNPKAGAKNGDERFVERLKETAQHLEQQVEVYITTAVGDGERITRKICEERKHRKVRIRFYACGGDGTLNEVLNGAMGYEDVEIGVIPMGTGNDFIRNFSGEDCFMDIEAQLKGQAVCCDVISYQGVIDGEKQTRYCANMINIGFDCNVADLTNKLKSQGWVKGHFAYLLAVMGTLIQKKGANLYLQVDGRVVQDGPLLLSSIANGRYCGGGVQSNAQARIDDGKMDVNVVTLMSRIRFLSLFPSYSKGKILQNHRAKKVITAYQGKQIVVRPKNGFMRICTDGEIFSAQEVCFHICQGAMNFVVPKEK